MYTESCLKKTDLVHNDAIQLVSGLGNIQELIGLPTIHLSISSEVIMQMFFGVGAKCEWKLTSHCRQRHVDLTVLQTRGADFRHRLPLGFSGWLQDPLIFSARFLRRE